MRTSALIIMILLASFVVADAYTQEFSIDKYNTVAVAPSQISQIYTNPDLSDMEDVELSPENQIKLFEEYSDNLCHILVDKSGNRVKFLCYKEIRSLLIEDQSWDDFNHYFCGKDKIYNEVSRHLAEKLQGDGVITSNLLFSYYKQANNSSVIEVYFEWDLIDLMTGQKVVGDNCSQSAELSENEPDPEKAEYDCFEESSDRFIEYFVNLYNFEKKN